MNILVVWVTCLLIWLIIRLTNWQAEKEDAKVPREFKGARFAYERIESGVNIKMLVVKTIERGSPADKQLKAGDVVRGYSAGMEEMEEYWGEGVYFEILITRKRAKNKFSYCWLYVSRPEKLLKQDRLRYVSHTLWFPGT